MGEKERERSLNERKIKIFCKEGKIVEVLV